MIPPSNPHKTVHLGEFPLEVTLPCLRHRVAANIHQLLKFIASYLPDLHGVLAFASVSRAFHAAVHGDHFVFRTLFLRSYEPPRAGLSGYDFTAAFQARTKLLHGRLEQPEADEVSRDILLDASPYRRSALAQPSSTNLSYLLCLLTPHSAELQLLLAPGLFDLAKIDVETMRMLKGRVHSALALRVFLCKNYKPEMKLLKWLWYVYALFAGHLDPARRQGTFYQAGLLLQQERPGFWQGRLQSAPGSPPPPLPSRWLAAYTYLVFPPGPEPGEFPEDVEESGDNFLGEFRLEETSLGVLEGQGKDYRSFTIRKGRLESLPEDSIGAKVPGWRKIRFIKEYGSHGWKYEGVLLPGGAVALGMWWDALVPRDRAEQGRYGVFMMWAIDEGCEELGRRDTRLAIR
ncbi:hypothetical protein FN846DRAFT_905711 [Sphaerosporella brunnea]|uniref:F-box domain-containing protein n=1 Tax=Sphaerosporella brunnea TaxID=1250544 RepID=A0A5J5F0C6_9PEZI|nr:hypothetical protein FN846DRAFT_905711 [Sphaerosporella brunnea]